MSTDEKHQGQTKRVPDCLHYAPLVYIRKMVSFDHVPTVIVMGWSVLMAGFIRKGRSSPGSLDPLLGSFLSFPQEVVRLPRTHTGYRLHLDIICYSRLQEN